MRSLLPACLALCLIAAGCSKDKDVEPPAALVKYPNKIAIKKLWGDTVGGGKKQVVLRLGLGPAVDAGTIFAASHKGEVIAVALDTGKQLWTRNLKLPLSAGPGAGNGMVVVGSSKGDLVALDAASGKERWRAKVNSELLSAPAVGENAVVFRAVDGRLHALDAGTGKELWQVEQQVPRLSLRGTAVPVIAKEVAISGFDNGKVMAVSLATGDTVWDTALASPHGRTELDRLVDVDSAVWVVGDNVFAAGFQGRTAMLALDSGQIWWAHDMSSYRGLAADAENIFVTESDGSVVAMRQRDGSELWKNDKLKRRGLSAPAILTSTIALADYQGYLHFLDRNSGELLARVRISKKRVSNPPVAADDTVVVLSDDGKLAGFRAGAPVAAEKAATPPAAAGSAPAADPVPGAAPPVDLSLPAPPASPPASPPR